MKRVLTAALAVAVLAGVSGCAAAVRGNRIDGPPGPDDKVTLRVWSPFTEREYDEFAKVLNDFHAQHPNITIESVGNQDDDKITQSIRGNNAPDVAVSWSTEQLGQYCATGSWQDLTPYLRRDDTGFENKIPDAVQTYTRFENKRCAMPLLADTYGLYYNKDLLAAKGIQPPKTMAELTEAAKKLTVRNPDGSIKVAGFVPLTNFYNQRAYIMAPLFNATSTTPDGRSAMGIDPGWKDMFTWQKELTDWYGYDNLARFTAGLGQQYSGDNAFLTGQVAMMSDGEYRTAFIKDQKPDLNYGTAPMPVSDRYPDRFGGGYATGTIVGIPKGAKHAGAAFELVKYLTLDTGALVKLGNGLRNVPTTKEALDSKDLDVDAQYQTFLDIFKNKNLAGPPATTNGSDWIKTVQDFGASWLSGKVPDLDDGLKKLDKQIDDSASIGGR
ncbi:ABC transporter substrate-binding protein [Pseudonocardiaceae bacterium YIM PH 21723]|nr:ABC transporter substrate-binding protein [Pseudonocardiaceae bacterium YIM PH 21723]